MHSRSRYLCLSHTYPHHKIRRGEAEVFQESFRSPTSSAILFLPHNTGIRNTMLDVFDFIVEKGGNPEKIKESQRRRYAPEEAVDEVIALYEDHRKSKYALGSSTLSQSANFICTAQYSVAQTNTKINEIQKQIGAKKKAKEDADDLLKQKAELGEEKKNLIELAAAKDVTLKKKIGTIGNIVHDSVVVNDNEVCSSALSLPLPIFVP